MAPDVLQKLKSLKKDYFTIDDLAKVFDMKRQSLQVALTRLEKRGAIIRLTKGVYQLPDIVANIPAIANQLYPESYISFETALAQYGILSQVPYTITFATIKRPTKVIIGEVQCEFRRLKPELFFGFSLADGVYFAEPEKALLDQLYMVSKGKGVLDTAALDLKAIKKSTLRRYMQQYPKATRQLARKTLALVGTSSVSVQ